MVIFTDRPNLDRPLQESIPFTDGPNFDRYNTEINSIACFLKWYILYIHQYLPSLNMYSLIELRVIYSHTIHAANSFIGANCLINLSLKIQ